MSFKSLNCLKLDPEIVETFEKHNVHTCKEALMLTRLELLNILGVCDKKREEIVRAISKECCPTHETACSLLEQSHRSPNKGFLPTSLIVFDKMLHGGIPLGSITELAGPPSVGKTQFCMQLCILATLPVGTGGLDGTAAYIDTESCFSAHRLKDIAVSRFPHIFHSDSQVFSLLQRVHVYKALTTKDLKIIGKNLESDIVRKGIKLIVLDSIASVFRKEFGSSTLESLVQRNNLLVEQASLFKNLAEMFGLVVFVTNQITAEIGAENDVISADSEEESDEATACETQTSPSAQERVSRDHVVPALGLTWSHCVTTRLVAQFTHGSNKRQLMVVKSPLVANAAVNYTITESGLNLTDDPSEKLRDIDPHQPKIRTKFSYAQLHSVES